MNNLCPNCDDTLVLPMFIDPDEDNYWCPQCEKVFEYHEILWGEDVDGE